MDEIKELEAYKELLDAGQITEDEFSLLKQKLLGLQTDEDKEAEREAARAQAMEDLKALREEEARKKEEARRQAEEDLDREEAEQLERERREAQEQAVQTFSEEKIKEKARLQAAQELEEERKARQTQKVRSSVKTATSIATTILLWMITVLLIFWGIGLFATSLNASMIISGILSFLLAVLACPLITARTRNLESFEIYYCYKRTIVILCVILWIVTFFAAFVIQAAGTA